MKYHPRNYQSRAAKEAFKRDYLGVWFTPGAGKTSVGLMVVSMMKQKQLPVKLLVIGPIKVIKYVWPDEIQKWDQFRDITYVILHGDKKAEALDEDVDVYLINPHGLTWLKKELARRGGEFPFLQLIVDEASLFKNVKSLRRKILGKWLPFFQKRITLTGSPTPRHLLDVYGHSSILDFGKSLLGNYYRFRSRYFFAVDPKGFMWVPKDTAKDDIVEAVSPFTMMINSDELTSLPPVTWNRIDVPLPSKAQQMYDEMKEEMGLEVDGVQVLAKNKGVLLGKLRQIGNGGLYLKDWRKKEKRDSKAKSLFIHDAKTDALEILVEGLLGSPLFVAIEFDHDIERIENRFGKVPVLGRSEDDGKLIDNWNAGEIPLMIGNPTAMSHGLNLQYGPCADICWYGLTWDLEAFEQTTKRFHRPGLGHPLTVHFLLANRSLDYITLRCLQKKDVSQKTIMKEVEISHDLGLL